MTASTPWHGHRGRRAPRGVRPDWGIQPSIRGYHRTSPPQARGPHRRACSLKITFIALATSTNRRGSSPGREAAASSTRSPGRSSSPRRGASASQLVGLHPGERADQHRLTRDPRLSLAVATTDCAPATPGGRGAVAGRRGEHRFGNPLDRRRARRCCRSSSSRPPSILHRYDHAAGRRAAPPRPIARLRPRKPAWALDSAVLGAAATTGAATAADGGVRRTHQRQKRRCRCRLVNTARPWASARALIELGGGRHGLGDRRRRAGQRCLKGGKGQLVHPQRPGQRMAGEAGNGVGLAEQRGPALRSAEQLVAAGRDQPSACARSQESRRSRLAGEQRTRGAAGQTRYRRPPAPPGRSQFR